MNAKMFAMVVALSAVGTLGAMPGMAKADHGHFAYRGPLCGCNGESQMIAALGHIADAADEYFHRHFNHAARNAELALEDLRVACHTVSSRHAHDDLHEAQRQLERFLHFTSVRYLERAAQLVRHALEVEQAAFRACPTPAPQPVIVQPAVRPVPVVRPVVVPQRAGISINGRNFGLRIRF